MYPSGMVMADTSVIARAGRYPAVAIELRRLATAYQLATCAPIDLEVGVTARTYREHADVMRERSELLIDLPLTEQVCDRAKDVLTLMAVRGQHRISLAADRLIAAAAEVHGALLLHYDKGFEAIGKFTGQPMQLLAPRGDVD